MARKKQAEAVVEEEVMPEAGVDLNEMAAGALADPAVQALLKDVEEEDEVPEPPQKKQPQDEQDSEGSDADDEPQLDDQLAELAARYNISPDLVEGVESLSEAQRFIDRYFKVMYREGESANFAPPMPQVEAPPKKSPVPEIDLSEYDDDDPIAKNFKALKGELDALKAEREQAQLAEFYRQQQEAAYHFGQALRKSAPELFGTDKKQDARQARNEREAFEAGNILVRGFASSGQRMPPLDVLAEQVLRMSFSEELSHKKATAKKDAIQDRMQRRSVGAPSRKSTNSALTSKEVYQGSAADDPELKRIINNKWAQFPAKEITMAKYLDDSTAFADFNEATQEYFERRKWVDLSHTNQDYVVTSRIFEGARFGIDGGKRLDWKIQKSNNTSYTHIGVGAILNPVPTDHLDGAYVNWAAAAVTAAWFVEEDDWQSGPEKIIDILTVNENALMSDITIGSENDLWSGPTVSGQNPRVPNGIPFWLQKASTNAAFGFNGGDPGAGAAAGIAVADVDTWKNGNFGYATVSQTDLLPKLSEAMEKCYFKAPRAYPALAPEKPDHVLYTTYPLWEAMQSLQTVSNDNLGNDVGKWRSTVMYKGVPMGWVPALTNSGSPVRDTSHPIYGIDWRNLKMFFKKGWDWVNPLAGNGTGGLEIPNGQPTARKTYKYAWYNYRCLNRRSMFVGHTTTFGQ